VVHVVGLTGIRRAARATRTEAADA